MSHNGARSMLAWHEWRAAAACRVFDRSRATDFEARVLRLKDDIVTSVCAAYFCCVRSASKSNVDAMRLDDDRTKLPLNPAHINQRGKRFIDSDLPWSHTQIFAPFVYIGFLRTQDARTITLAKVCAQAISKPGALGQGDLGFPIPVARKI